MDDRDDLVPAGPRSFDLDDPRLVAGLRELVALCPRRLVGAGFSNYMPVPWNNVYPVPAPAPDESPTS